MSLGGGKGRGEGGRRRGGGGRGSGERGGDGRVAFKDLIMLAMFLDAEVGIYKRKQANTLSTKKAIKK